VTSREMRQGDVVELRRPNEILATLDANGETDRLPFMDELTTFYGRLLTVAHRAERVCDTIYYSGMRRLRNTVIIDNGRCDGSGHGGCQAECLLYFKECWLRPVADGTTSATIWDDAEIQKLRVAVSPHAGGDTPAGYRYRCQATRAFEASLPISPASPRSYLREYTSGNVPVTTFVKVLSRAVVMESAKKLRLLPEPRVKGESSSSLKTERLGLQVGEWVKVKSRHEIEQTLNDKGKNRGLWFDREMLEFCEKVFQVRSQVERIVDERNGQLIELNDCVILDGAACSGVWSLGRWFCPRAIFPYWREGWLERVEAPVQSD
jgi:hypothetical protein